jgi:hypothetical protein
MTVLVVALQVHGHDFSCVASLAGAPGRPPAYASGSEEKVIRVLEAPRAFLATLALSRDEAPDVATPPQQATPLPGGPSLPCLSLPPPPPSPHSCQVSFSECLFFRGVCNISASYEQLASRRRFGCLDEG